MDTNESAADRLWRLGDLVTPMAVRVAVTLRLADHIAEGVTTVAGLAERTGTDPGALARLLRHLASIGLVTSDRDGFGLTGLGEALRRDHPGWVAASLDLDGVISRIALASVRLLDSVRTGRAAYPLVYGRGFWEDLASDRELSDRFDRHMGSGDVSPAVAAYDWAGAGSVVDVGGGSGALLAGILHANPNVTGTLVDLPGPARSARQRFAEEGLADRAAVVEGTFFDPLPGGAGAYILSNVIHDWADAETTAIFHRCAEAAGASGKILLFEGVLESADDLAAMTGFDLFMLVCCGGRQRTVAELESLGAAAGLRLVATSKVDPSFGWLVELQSE